MILWRFCRGLWEPSAPSGPLSLAQDRWVKQDCTMPTSWTSLRLQTVLPSQVFLFSVTAPEDPQWLLFIQGKIKCTFPGLALQGLPYSMQPFLALPVSLSLPCPQLQKTPHQVLSSSLA